MIEIDLLKNKAHSITGFTVRGHAGYAESGADIVCASVTTAVLTAANGLTDVACISAEITAEEGYLSCILPQKLTEAQRRDADLLLNSMVLTLEQLTAQYGDYVELHTID